MPPAGDIGREQLSEAVIGYNDLERAKVRQRPDAHPTRSSSGLTDRLLVADHRP